MVFKEVDLEKLFRLMKENDISETTLRDGKTIVIVKRGKEQIIVNAPGIHHETAQIPTPQGEAVKTVQKPTHPVDFDKKKEEKPVSTSTSEPGPDNYYTITAPLVGTFFRASRPDSDPFVEVGDRVAVGDVLCIVEAMKSMNEIQSDVNGVVKAICVENSQMVEFEQPLFKIDTAG
jgi:acetyl-CoA carboxylase biotin carboxyl carrier protein